MSEDLQKSIIASPALMTLFELTTDALIFFDASGYISASNQYADEIFNVNDLAGRSIYDLFYHVNLQKAQEGDLPFPVDGTVVTMFACPAPGILIPVELSCKSYIEAREIKYLLLLKDVDLLRENERERERLLHQLARSNTRLEGMLEIISSTLGSSDFEGLTQSVLETLTSVMEADTVLLYLVEEQGYRLSGCSRTVSNLKVGHFFIPHFKGLPGLVDKSGSSIYLQFLEPFDSSPAAAIDLKSGEHIHVESAMNSWFKTAVGLPLYSGDTLVGVILILWSYPLMVMSSDLLLMETVADYLSVEFTSALSLMRHRKVEQLDYLLSQLRDLFYSSERIDKLFFHSLMNKVRRLVPFEYVLVLSNPWTQEAVATFSEFPGRDGVTEHRFPFKAYRDYDPSYVQYVDGQTELGKWIASQSELSHGLFLHMGELFGSEVDMFALRPESSAPFDAVERNFLSSFAQTVRSCVQGEKERSNETKISHVLQKALRNELPEIEGLKVSGLYSSATEQAVVGGDYFDLFELDNRRVIALVGDISGKGVEAASMASLVKTAIAAYAWNSMDPAHIVSALNKLFLNFSRIESFTTLFVALIDLNTMSAQYCCAGHPPAFLFHPNKSNDGGELELLNSFSPIVGAFEDMTYSNGYFEIKKGDVLFLYTDGTTEARSPDGSFFGEEALKESFLQLIDYGAEELNENILMVLEHFTQGQLNDDIAMVSIEFEV